MHSLFLLFVILAQTTALHSAKEKTTEVLTLEQERSGGYLNIFFKWVWSEELQEIATKETSIKRKDEELADDRRKMEADVAAKLRAVEEREERAAKALQESQEKLQEAETKDIHEAEGRSSCGGTVVCAYLDWRRRLALNL